MNFFEEYKYIIIPILTVLSAQLIKFLIEVTRNKTISVERLLNGNGGMPSSHTAFTTSLTTCVGIGVGFNSPLFAACTIFTIIVAYDSMGLRMESGKQAVAINKLMKKNNIKCDEKLKEMLGHKPLEVLAGIIFGILFATFLMNIL